MLKKIWRSAGEHRYIILCAFALSILIELPLIAFPFIAKDQYRGINLAHFGTDEHYYLSRAHEILDGNGLGNGVLKTGKDGQDSFFTYAEYALFYPIYLVGLGDRLDIVKVYNVYNFLGVFILILLIYYFVLQLSGDKRLSMAASVFAIGGYSIIYNKTLFYTDFNIYGRAMYPFISSLSFFIFLNLLAKSLKTKSKRYIWLSGAALGGIFYVYFYAWTFAASLMASLLAVYILRKDFGNAKKIFYVGAIGGLAGLPVVVKMFLFFRTPMGRQIQYYLWSSSGHTPIFSKIGFAALVLFAVYFIKNRKDENAPFILGLILAGWLALNQQIISGRMVQYAHYYWYFIVPLCIILGFYMLSRLLNGEMAKKILFTAAIVLAYLNTAVGQVKSIPTTLNEKLYEQRYRPFIDYLKKDTSRSVVLAADDANEILITVYTQHDLFWGASALIHVTQFQNIKDAFFVYAYLNKDFRKDFPGFIQRAIDDDNFESFYEDMYKHIEGYAYGKEYYRYVYEFENRSSELLDFRKKLVANLYKDYKERAGSQQKIENLLKRYDVRYILWDINKNPEWDLSFVRNLKEAKTDNGIGLYKVEISE